MITENKIVLKGSYGNGIWEPLVFLNSDEEDQCQVLLEEFVKTFGSGWAFKWGRQ